MRIPRFLSVFSMGMAAIIMSVGLSLMPAKALPISPTTAASAGDNAIIQVRSHGGHSSGFARAGGGGGPTFHAYSGNVKAYSGGNFQNFRAYNAPNVYSGNIRANNVQVNRAVRNNPNFNQNIARSSRLAYHRHHRRFIGFPYYDGYDDYGYDYSDYDDYGYSDEGCYKLVPRRHNGHLVWRRLYICS